MSRKTISVCDGCGDELHGSGDDYRIARVYLKTSSYTDAAGDFDYNSIALEFCPCCSTRLLTTLEKIAARTKKG